RIELMPERSQGNTAPKCSGRKARTHIAERRRRWNRPGGSQSDIGMLIAIQRNTITAYQPVRELGLSLAEQFEIEIPDALYRSHPIVRTFLAHNDLLQP